MKLQIGTKLHAIRDERRLTQEEMGELLHMSTSAYARLERNETRVDVEDLQKFSKTLNIPMHEFLPDTFSIHNTNHGQASVVFGNVYFNCNFGDSVKQNFLNKEPKNSEDKKD